MEQFTIIKQSKDLYFFNSGSNAYSIIVSDKGIGIYLQLPECNILCKQYYNSNMQTAINYLLKKELFY